MNPQSHFINSHVVNPTLPHEKSVAVQIMEASLAERTHVASGSSSSSSFPPAKVNKKNTEASDAASVSSFGSSVGLLKNKFHFSSSSSSSASKNTSPRSGSSQKQVLRNQVNIVG